MRLVKQILSGLILLVLALVAIAFVLPDRAVVARSIVIEADPDRIFPHVNSMQKTEAWSPWLSRDPNTKLTYSGPDSGVGNKLEWASDHPQVGSGTQEITASTANASVETALDFGPMGTAKASFTLASAEGGTEVTWGFVTELGLNPMARWMGLMMDRWVGADYEAGLENLKSLVESEG